MNYFLLLAIFSAALGIFQRGYNFRTINVPHQNIKKFLNETFKERYDIDLTPHSISTYYSIAMSIFPIGIMVGSLCGRSIAEKLGRKKGQLYPLSKNRVGSTYCPAVLSYTPISF